MLGKTGYVYLSDGTEVDTDSGRIGVIDTSYVVVDKIKLVIKRGTSDLQPQLAERHEPSFDSTYAEPPPDHVIAVWPGGLLGWF